MNSKLDTSRIDYLLGDSQLNDTKIVVVGLGSGGMAVLERLAMCGVGKWSLYDPDHLEAVNLAKHSAKRSDLGRSKVQIATEWLRDRNPSALIERTVGDVFTEAQFSDDVSTASVLVCAVDNPAAREFVNDVCVKTGVPCVSGAVFRTGLGGEVYAYIPGETGCLACKTRVTNDIDDWLELTEEETQKIYGMGEADFIASGLAVDIALVASLHAHYIISLLAGKKSKYLTPPSFNQLTIALRRVNGLFESMYETTRALIRPQGECHLDCGTVRAN